MTGIDNLEHACYSLANRCSLFYTPTIKPTTNKEQIIATFKKMAIVVDRQNEGDPNYKNMSSDFDTNIEFQAALDLVFKGRDEPNGYTENVLHSRRREFKASV